MSERENPFFRLLRQCPAGQRHSCTDDQLPYFTEQNAGLSGEERSALIAGLGDYALLILDDLEVERNTEFALEQMF